jgi:hypothetical protein
LIWRGDDNRFFPKEQKSNNNINHKVLREKPLRMTRFSSASRPLPENTLTTCFRVRNAEVPNADSRAPKAAFLTPAS